MNRRRGRPPLPAIEDLATHHERVVNVSQLARYWGVHVESVRVWCRTGLLPSRLIGNTRKVTCADALAFESRQAEWRGRSVARGTLSIVQ